MPFCGICPFPLSWVCMKDGTCTNAILLHCTTSLMLSLLLLPYKVNLSQNVIFQDTKIVCIVHELWTSKTQVLIYVRIDK
jgi:hypothetical protein